MKGINFVIGGEEVNFILLIALQLSEKSCSRGRKVSLCASANVRTTLKKGLTKACVFDQACKACMFDQTEILQEEIRCLSLLVLKGLLLV